MRILFDLDGCFANFVDGFAEVIAKVGGSIPPQSDSYPDVFAYDKRDLPPDIRTAAWMEVGRSHNFWMHLKPYDDKLMAKLSAVQHIHDFYFGTNRPGPTTKFQTEVWLMNWFSNPTVLISGDKASLAKALSIDVATEDQVSNANGIAEAMDGKGIVLLLDRPWNRGEKEENRVARVKSLDKALGHILWPDGEV